MWTWQTKVRSTRVAVCESGMFREVLGYSVCPWGWKFDGRHVHVLDEKCEPKGMPVAIAARRAA
jgi:hypothetical protein